ncbi:UNC-like C-terminal-domain-containing protein [Gigaspora rosea]|uniref:UNC-like C-terminal-domain-containing protein n=1 Tax=Gigaspora rosea TaxID=44941 RepID=A0A397V133_9GLOM|nr:UNC-like C-terminal-domain-containing protein [Gigaspora rosea]
MAMKKIQRIRFQSTSLTLNQSYPIKTGKDRYEANCFCFTGTHGQLAIHLSNKIKVVSITYEHLNPTLALDPDDMRRAPKTFEIVGISVDSQEKYDEYFQLGSFDYKLYGPPAQSFEINLQNLGLLPVMKAVILKIMGNWGFKDFLTKSMKYFFVEELRPIIFSLLNKYPKRMTEEIYEISAQELAKKPDIIHVIINMDRVNLSEAPIGIKRGLYERNNTIFKEFIYSQFSKYLQKREINLDQRDVAMIFQDPIVYNVLSTQIVEVFKKCIIESFTDDTVKKENIQETVKTVLAILLNEKTLFVKWMSLMITFGSYARKMLLDENPRIPQVFCRYIIDRCENRDVLALNRALKYFKVTMEGNDLELYEATCEQCLKLGFKI